MQTTFSFEYKDILHANQVSVTIFFIYKTVILNIKNSMWRVLVNTKHKLFKSIFWKSLAGINFFLHRQWHVTKLPLNNRRNLHSLRPVIGCNIKALFLKWATKIINSVQSLHLRFRKEVPHCMKFIILWEHINSFHSWFWVAIVRKQCLHFFLLGRHILMPLTTELDGGLASVFFGVTTPACATVRGERNFLYAHGHRKALLN